MEKPMNPQDQHDPGGRVKLKLPEGVRGAAQFSPCGRYRQYLLRDWTPEGETPRTIMFVGMNPSTADADASDPTVHRETTFARDWGFTRYLKANVLDWRATNPKDLPKDPGVACSQANLLAIADMAEQSSQIIIAHGKMPKIFHPVIKEVVALCRASAADIFCLGRNADGSAKHPLYLAKTTQRMPY
jgi:hypothetical protein